MPVLATRLVLSLKKAADLEPGIEWGVDHFIKRIEPRSVFELQPRENSRGPD